MTMTIIPLVTLSVGDPLKPTLVLPGEVVEMNEGEGRRLIERQFAISGANNGQSQLAQSDDLDAIVDAIAELPTNAYGKDGKPSVKAIQSIIDVEITAAQRDQAWQQFQLLSQS